MKTAKKMLGERIKEIRINRGLTQEKLSEMVESEAKYLSKIEVGQKYPSLEYLENMAKALDVELKDFFDFRHLKDGDAQAIKARNVETLKIEKMLDGFSSEKRLEIVKVIKAMLKLM